jgi:hypothetical protein
MYTKYAALQVNNRMWHSAIRAGTNITYISVTLPGRDWLIFTE